MKHFLVALFILASSLGAAAQTAGTPLTGPSVTTDAPVSAFPTPQPAELNNKSDDVEVVLPEIGPVPPPRP